MNRQENLRLVLQGKTPAWIPFSLNFRQWFDYHKSRGTLPPELAGVDYIQAMKALGCDIFTRNVDGGFRSHDNHQTEIRENSLGQTRITTWSTPYGELRKIDQEQREQFAWHTEEYPVKEWETDGRAALWLLEHTTIGWEETAALSIMEDIGADGILNIPFACSPLKKLHHDFGLTGTCYFMMDEPEAAKEYCDRFWSKVMPQLCRIARHPRTESVILMDNVDTPFYTPAAMERYWLPYVREAADCLRQEGKYLWVHACGKLKDLSSIIRDSGVTGLEGVSHPPLGDWWIDEAQACHPGFIFNGGFSAAEQEMKTPEEVAAFYRIFLPRAKRERCIFSASCQTNIRTPWERILQVRDIVRAWGGDRPQS